MPASICLHRTGSVDNDFEAGRKAGSLHGLLRRNARDRIGIILDENDHRLPTYPSEFDECAVLSAILKHCALVAPA